MMPLFTPTNAFSARCATSAMRGGSHGSSDAAASARATASSSAALDERRRDVEVLRECGDDARTRIDRVVGHLRKRFGPARKWCLGERAQSRGGALRREVALRLTEHLVADEELADRRRAEERRIEVH